MAVDPKIDKLRDMRVQAQLGGGQARIDREHAKGKLTARERIDRLLDPGTFRELDMFATHRTVGFGTEETKILSDSVVTGWGQIDGRLVYLFSQDFTVFGGSLGEVHAEKVCKIMDLAMKNGAPVIGLNDSGGARIQEGVVSLAAYAYVFLRNVLASGVVPQISAIMGPCAGGAVYSPAMTDFILMVKGTSFMHITGPDVIRTVTREEVTSEGLGGAMVHNAVSGVAHFAAEGEEDCFYQIRKLLSYLPQNNMEDPPFVPTDDPVDRKDEALDTLVPDNPNKPYNMKELIRRVVDDGDFFEVQEHWAQNILIGFARLGGLSVGIVAQQPMVLAGVLMGLGTDWVHQVIGVIIKGKGLLGRAAGGEDSSSTQLSDESIKALVDQTIQIELEKHFKNLRAQAEQVATNLVQPPKADASDDDSPA